MDTIRENWQWFAAIYLMLLAQLIVLMFILIKIGG